MQIEVKKDFEIKKLTTFKVGGIVSALYIPKSINELVYLLENLDDYVVLGGCSNILFSSEGYDGNVILTSNINNFEINNNIVYAECGVKGPLLSQKAANSGLSGFEFMIGFPGSVGGEIYMNASAHGQSISDTLKFCSYYDKNEKCVIKKNRNDLFFDYRKSQFQNSDSIILSAEFELQNTDINKIKVQMSQNLDKRNGVQPNLKYPNAGSVFRNPPNESAGKLLESIGAKSFKVNDAEVWSRHANFIINSGNATSEDILKLMLKMYTEVKEKYTIELVPEILYIGNKNKNEEKICQILYRKMQK